MEKRSCTSKTFLDSNQYTHRNIIKYERMFGETFVSTGGERTAKAVCEIMPLKPGTRVLDIGAGSGGMAIYIARGYGSHVTGIDLSGNMLALARERKEQLPSQIKDLVQFIEGDITEMEYAAGSFDVIHSRDTFLHISDKQHVFQKLRQWLASDGHLVLTDYCQREHHTLSQQFLEYKQRRGYHLTTVREYEQLLKAAGFSNVIALDRTRLFLEILRSELNAFQLKKDEFIEEFSEDDYQDIAGGWREKIARAEEGSQRWALFQATK